MKCKITPRMIVLSTLAVRIGSGSMITGRGYCGPAHRCLLRVLLTHDLKVLEINCGRLPMPTKCTLQAYEDRMSIAALTIEH